MDINEVGRELFKFFAIESRKISVIVREIDTPPRIVVWIDPQYYSSIVDKIPKSFLGLDVETCIRPSFVGCVRYLNPQV